MDWQVLLVFTLTQLSIPMIIRYVIDGGLMARNSGVLHIGLAVLVTITQIDGNLRRQFLAALPEHAPSFYFIDIPAADADRFSAFLKKTAQFQCPCHGGLYDAKTGAVRWKSRINSELLSAPAIVPQAVVFRAVDGRVVAVVAERLRMPLVHDAEHAVAVAGRRHDNSAIETLPYPTRRDRIVRPLRLRLFHARC